ncbi:MAG TPA: HAD family hydrolase [Vicinamibacterales bacterium]|nr:HAD family hydrolase [Vicinamibacterales bacterium]
MNKAILFDMGGTLDGDGLHWLDRFVLLYAAAGVELPRPLLRGAFDDAECRAATDDDMGRAALAPMLDRHLQWQFEALRATEYSPRLTPALRERIVTEFSTIVKNAARANVDMLTRLKARGFVLGVVSNGCGNVDVLCDDLGYAPLMSLVIDSRRVKLFKPDPAIYTLAAARIGLPPASIMMVGDSFDRDVRPAKAIGMRTAWLQGLSGGPCPDPSLADVVLRELRDLPAAIDARERTVA